MDHGGLDRAAAAVTERAAAAPGAMRGMRTNHVAAALPGSLSAGKAANLDGQWVDAARSISDALTKHAEALELTAQNYKQIEEAHAAISQQFFGGIG